MTEQERDNRSELERTLEAVKRLGRVEDIDAARVQAVRSMALSLDYDPSNAALWRQYREAIKELTASGSSSLDAELRGLFADTGTQVGDPPAS